MSTSYLSLGSNLGDRELNLSRAMAELQRAGKVTKVSSLYETEPMELAQQPWFLNCVVELQTELSPEQLLAFTESVEQQLGRKRDIPKGPRTIDIDLLLFDDAILGHPHSASRDVSGDSHAQSLTIPHPSMTARRFVLAPLAEIAPDLRHPTSGQRIADLLRELDGVPGEVRRLAS